MAARLSRTLVAVHLRPTVQPAWTLVPARDYVTAGAPSPDQIVGNQQKQRDPREHDADLRDPHDIYDEVNPEKYFEHAEQTVPDDKPMEYVKVKTAEKMADVTEESKMAAHMLKNYAQEVTDKVVQTIKHPIESAKEAGKIISDRSAGAGPSPDTRSKK